jgi:concentrative nucleoside transporter, CNT family
VSDLRGLLGLALVLALAFAISEHRGRINPRTIALGLAIQVAFAVLVLRWSVGQDVLDFVSGQVKALIDYANAGIGPMFGRLVADKEATIFALQVLPVIVFLGALIGLLFYLGLIQWITEIFGGAISWLLTTSKVESRWAATVIFFGQSEAPLIIRPRRPRSASPS